VEGLIVLLIFAPKDNVIKALVKNVHHLPNKNVILQIVNAIKME
jgi:hypothetical protein